MIGLEMIRDGSTVAEIAISATGKTVIVWPTSVIVYDTPEAAWAVHVEHMGARGAKTRWEVVHQSKTARQALNDCLMDDMENAPFASVGAGTQKNHFAGCPSTLQPPQHIDPSSADEYVQAYEIGALLQYGSNWRTTSFSWVKALTINPRSTEKPTTKLEGAAASLRTEAVTELSDAD